MKFDDVAEALEAFGIDRKTAAAAFNAARSKESCCVPAKYLQSPVGSVWADEKYGGRLYEVVTHAFACGDVISDDPLVVYRDAMNHRAVFTRGVTTFAERFVRRR